MVGRDGGKLKPLKQAKKGEKVVLDEDIEFKKKMVCYIFGLLKFRTRRMKRRRSPQPRKLCRRNKISVIVQTLT